MDKVVVISGNSNRKLAQDITNNLGIQLYNVDCNKFSNTEIRIKIQSNKSSIRNKKVFIVQTGTYLSNKDYSINDYLMEALILIQACTLSAAKSINIIMPYYPYSRQDKKDDSGEPITAKLIADILQVAGVDRAVFMDLHAPQIQGMFNIPIDNLYSVGLVYAHLEKTLFNGYTPEERGEKYIVVSPDAGATKRTLAFAKVMKLDTVILHKQRNYQVANCVESILIIGEQSSYQGKTAIILDDMIDTAGTLIRASEMLVDSGVKEVIAVATHGILSGPAISRINECRCIKRVVVSDSIPQELNLTRCDKLEVFSIAEHMSQVIDCIVNGKSISDLF
jgi:ribose-phosphate pyrophosphokinase